MLGIVFPHQCFHLKYIPASWTHIIFVRHDIAYGGTKTVVSDFCDARKAFFRAIEDEWVSMVRSKIPIEIVDRGVKWYTNESAECWDPVDAMLEKELEHCPNIRIIDSPAFLLTRAEAAAAPIKGHAAFYAMMRKKYNILMENGGPVGGQWRYDKENRLPLPAGIKLPDWTKEMELRSEGASIFPVTHAGARAALKRFLEKRLSNFGPYEDAIIADDNPMFHSVLSAPINAGLLTPHDIIDAALKYMGRVPIQSLEGFIAQVLGWREFMRAVYVQWPEPPANRLNHRRKLGSAWYTGTTGLVPVDAAIRRVNKWGYLHHIERLMVVGNAMFLCEIKPAEVFKWFMEMFVDSYDWVMVGNVYYMSQWASSAITTKPYISSSAYILRMSNYRRGEWSAVWDALYWRKVSRMQELLKKNYRMAAQVAFWEKKSAADKKELLGLAEEFLRKL
jgi:deoxyribodipyrimidine photolyase-related protein